MSFSRPRRPLPSGLLEKASRAVPPARFPRGYFDPLVSVTRQLLDKGLSLAQAAAWLAGEGALETRDLGRYRAAMRNRLSRLRQKKKTAPGETHRWRAALFYDGAHAVGRGTAALCGARTASWLEATGSAARCVRCKGVAARLGVTVEE